MLRIQSLVWIAYVGAFERKREQPSYIRRAHLSLMTVFCVGFGDKEDDMSTTFVVSVVRWQKTMKRSLFYFGENEGVVLLLEERMVMIGNRQLLYVI